MLVGVRESDVYVVNFVMAPFVDCDASGTGRFGGNVKV